VEAGVRRPPASTGKLVEVRQRSVLERGIATVTFSPPCKGGGVRGEFRPRRVGRAAGLTDPCSWESSRPPKPTHRVRILAGLLERDGREGEAPAEPIASGSAGASPSRCKLRRGRTAMRLFCKQAHGGSTPSAGLIGPESVTEARPRPKRQVEVRFLVGMHECTKRGVRPRGLAR
jgi:hypothetical protein